MSQNSSAHIANWMLFQLRWFSELSRVFFHSHWMRSLSINYSQIAIKYFLHTQKRKFTLKWSPRALFFNLRMATWIFFQHRRRLLVVEEINLLLSNLWPTFFFLRVSLYDVNAFLMFSTLHFTWASLSFLRFLFIIGTQEKIDDPKGKKQKN